jgi:hypothetical protein
MPRFDPQTPVVTDVPIIVVDAGLPPGRYRFRLVAVDEAGNQSAPDEREVIILSVNRNNPVRS